jgi:hypothetical protein
MWQNESGSCQNLKWKQMSEHTAWCRTWTWRRITKTDHLQKDRDPVSRDELQVSKSQCQQEKSQGKLACSGQEKMAQQRRVVPTKAAIRQLSHIVRNVTQTQIPNMQSRWGRRPPVRNNYFSYEPNYRKKKLWMDSERIVEIGSDLRMVLKVIV